jgi:hypothetical protein
MSDGPRVVDGQTMEDRPAAYSSSWPVRDSFVVRIWREVDHNQWRGWVQHIRTGDELLVGEMDQLLAFIECRTKGVAQSSSAEPPSGLR